MKELELGNMTTPNINTYIKKPVEISALQYDGNNAKEIISFTGDLAFVEDNSLIIPTLEGNHKVTLNDYVIRGIKGEFYPCKEDIFLESYTIVE